MPTPSKDIAVPEAERFPVLVGDTGSIDEVLRANFGDEGIKPTDLDRISVPPGGATSWEVNTLEGSESTKQLTGVIVAWKKPRTYWAQSLDETGGGQPPDCFSDEGEIGNGEYGPGSPENPTGRCDQCPMNQWGSDPGGGKGKACKEQRLLFLLHNEVLPVTVSLSPTSIQPLRKYMLGLASKGLPFHSVVTTLEVEKVESGAFKYGVVKPSLNGYLSDEASLAARKFGESIKGEGTAAAASGSDDTEDE